jgi:hypothetical protein
MTKAADLSLLNKIFYYFGKITSFIIVILIVAISALSVTEIATRIAAKSFIESRIDSLEKELVSERSNSLTADKAERRFNQVSFHKNISIDLDHLSLTGASTEDDTVYAIRHKLANYEKKEALKESRKDHELQISDVSSKIKDLEKDESKLKQYIAKLNFRLAHPMADDKITELREELTVIEEEFAFAKKSIANEKIYLQYITSLKDSSQEALIRIEDSNFQLSEYAALNIALYLSSDVLLAITVILCGAIGSIIASIKAERSNYFSSISSGILAGFVAFLVVKGGKFLFLIKISAGSSILINPFAAAFAGILAGLFTGKGHEILESLVNGIASKVKEKFPEGR